MPHIKKDTSTNQGVIDTQDNDLTVIAAAKKIAEHIFRVTQSSPQRFRFSLVGRMQNITLDIIALLYLANETFVDMKLLMDMDKSIRALSGAKTYASWVGHAKHGNTYRLRGKILGGILLKRKTELEEVL